MAAFILANGMEEPANMKKSREEIEIMEGILNTTPYLCSTEFKSTGEAGSCL
jgi:hypothetical protein